MTTVKRLGRLEGNLYDGSAIWINSESQFSHMIHQTYPEPSNRSLSGNRRCW